MNYLLYYPGAAEVTGPRLAQGLGISGGSRPPEERRLDVLIRFGSTALAPRARRTVNKARAIRKAADKRGSLLTFLEHGIPAPRPSGFPPVLPAVGRKRRHQMGYGFWLCLQEADVRSAQRAGADYFIPYIPTRDEYRVHVIDGLVLFMQHKERTTEEAQPFTSWIRNKRMGWRLVRCPEIPAVAEAGVRAVAALGLDFGAVDILISDHSELFVLEVNTAPALKGVQLEDWSRTLRRFLCAE